MKLFSTAKVLFLFSSVSIFALAASLIPLVSHAATPSSFKELVNIIVGLINTAVVPLLFAIAVALFIWGILKYIFIKSNEEIQTGREVFFWGIIVLFVALSVWGFVNLLTGTFFPDLL